MTRRAAVTGASGYLGSTLVRALDGNGWRTIRLQRVPIASQDRRFVLGSPVGRAELEGVDLLVHAAYDMRLTREQDIWDINVRGTQMLLEAARDAGIARIIVLSSMSAFDGTTQIYGRAKLAIERIAFALGAAVVRPGLVVGPQPGGMAKTLARLVSLPLTPCVSGAGLQYPLRETDFVAAMLVLAEAAELPLSPLGLASARPVPFDELLRLIASGAGLHSPRLVPVPHQLVSGVLRAAEWLRLPIPIRSDSLLGLLRPAPSVPGVDDLKKLGVSASTIFS